MNLAKRSAMSYTKEDLKKKLLDTYPEITTYNLSVAIKE